MRCAICAYHWSAVHRLNEVYHFSEVYHVSEVSHTSEVYHLRVPFEGGIQFA